MVAVTVPYHTPFVRPRHVTDQLGITNQQMLRWRQYTGIQAEQRRGPGHRLRMSACEVHQLLTFQTITNPEGDSRGAGQVTALRWVWYPAMLALDVHCGGWLVSEPNGDWEWFSTADLAVAKGRTLPFCSLLDLTPPYSLAVWLDMRWQAHERGT